MRKVVFFLIAFLIIVGSLSSETMYLNMHSGEIVEFELAEIDQITFSGSTSFEEIGSFISQIPVSLLKNYPNPFNPSTTITFVTNQKGITDVEIFNLRGQKLITLSSTPREPGTHSVTWDGKDSNGKNVAAGMYFYKVSVNNHGSIQKMLLLK